MTGLSRQLTGIFHLQSLWVVDEEHRKKTRNGTGLFRYKTTQFVTGTGHLFVTGKNPVLTGKYAQMTELSRQLTGIMSNPLFTRYNPLFSSPGVT